MKRFFMPVLAGLLSLCVANVSYANGFGAAMAGAMANKAVASGFSFNDPRIAATAAAMGAAAADIAGGLASGFAGGVAAVPWAAVAGGAGIGGLLVVPTPLGGDDSPNWQFNPDGTVTIPSSSPATGASENDTGNFPPLVAGGVYWDAGNDTGCLYCGGDIYAALQAYIQYHTLTTAAGVKITFKAGTCSAYTCNYTAEYDYSPTSIVGPNTYSLSMSKVGGYTGSNCTTGIVVGGKCADFVDPNAVTAPPVTESPASAAAATPASAAAEPLNPAIVAGGANALWSKAATQPQYSGLPYPIAAPITPVDAAADESSMAGAWPTVGDFTSGAGASSSGVLVTPFATTIPATSSTGASAVPAATTAGAGEEINLGTDPGIGSPTLEQTPTAAQILAPILGMLPDLRTYGVPAHTSICPKPSFELWGETYAFTAQCDLIEQNRPEIYGAFVLMWSLVALFIVLTA